MLGDIFSKIHRTHTFADTDVQKKSHAVYSHTPYIERLCLCVFLGEDQEGRDKPKKPLPRRKRLCDLTFSQFLGKEIQQSGKNTPLANFKHWILGSFFIFPSDFFLLIGFLFFVVPGRPGIKKRSIAIIEMGVFLVCWYRDR